MIYCRACGIALKDRKQQFCSEKCRHDIKHMKTRKTCLYCGKEYLTFKKNKIYCTRACGVKNSNQRHRCLGEVNPLLPYVSMGISCKGAVTSPPK